MFPSKYTEMIGIQYAFYFSSFCFKGTLCSWANKEIKSLATTSCAAISGDGGGCKRKNRN